MIRDRKECPESSQIELFILRKLSDLTDYQTIEQHLEQCDKCKELLSELRVFYSLFYGYLYKPVANKVFQLTKDIEKDNVVIAGILLKPQLLDEKPGERHFTSEIILSSHNSKFLGLDHLDSISLKKDEILIRAIQSTNTDETTLFLYAENKKLYSEVTLKIHVTNKSFKSDKKGKIEVGHIDISNFDSQEVMIISNN